MKVVILAGGLGTRISEESQVRPKPMIEIGGKPILWHIMKIYHKYGYNDFVICLGYKGHVIKEYFQNYLLNESDVTFDFQDLRRIEIHHRAVEPWRVTLVDTGQDTMTGGRIRRIQRYVQDEPFLLTYGDGVSNLDIRELVKFHQSHGRTATVTAVQPTGRYGFLNLGTDFQVREFREKPKGDGGWVSGGFFVFEPAIFNYLTSDTTILEKEPLETLALQGELMAYKCTEFWYSMDTQRDKKNLDEMIKNGVASWETW